MYHFRALQDISMEQLAQCFNLAFSDYEQPICFTPKSLKYYLTASAVNLSLSFGAFWEEELVGFILNSGGVYHGESVVFDAGTGVVPDHRGKKVFSALFDYTSQQLQHRICNSLRLLGNQHAAFPAAQHIRYAAHRRGNNRQARAHRLNNGHGHSLKQGRQQKNVRLL